MEVLDLNSENEAEKKGIADDIYLNKNADAGLAAPLLEPSQNEGVMLSEDSSEKESKYAVIDIVQQSEDEVDSSIRCCSCFSFFIPTWNSFKIFQSFGRKSENYSEVLPSQDKISSCECDGDLGPRKYQLFSIFGPERENYFQVLQSSDDYALGPSNSGSFGDDLINEFKRPVKQVDLPRPKGS